VSGHWPPALPYPWDAHGTRLVLKTPEPGTLVALRHMVWRVVEIRDYPADLQDVKRPKVHVILRPAGRGDDVRDRDYDVSLSVSVYMEWQVYEDGHYPACVECGEPTPCRDTMARREAEKSASRAAAKAAKAELGCMACGEPVTTRQKSVVFDGMNLDAPTAPSPVFHLRAQCFHWAIKYERHWVPAEPGRRWRLQCSGENRRHEDGWECTQAADCPGADAYHRNRVWCAHQETRCLRCVDARAAGLAVKGLPGDPKPRRRPRPAKPTAPAGYVVPAAKLGAVVHVTDASRPECPMPVKLEGRAVVAQYPPGAVLGHTLCDLEMLAEDAWVSYRADPAADGSLCGECGKRAGVALDQREAS
jgi:hypothetical protein